MDERLEFRLKGKDAVLSSAISAMVPPVGSFISIRKKTYKVYSATFALDYGDQPESFRRMRCCIDLEATK